MTTHRAVAPRIEVGEFLYEAVARFTSITAFGASLGALASGTSAPPAEGARFDFAFAGEFRGPRLTGTITGVDYANFRGDGMFELDVRAHLQTRDGHSIAITAGGSACPDREAGTYQLKQHITYRTAAPAYAWLNQVQAWGRGAVDVATGELRLTVYAA
jgi:hypothetical protein